jgi:hypothetical protein
MARMQNTNGTTPLEKAQKTPLKEEFTEEGLCLSSFSVKNKKTLSLATV